MNETIGQGSDRLHIASLGPFEITSDLAGNIRTSKFIPFHAHILCLLLSVEICISL